MSGFSPEFRLLAACCRWPDDAQRADAIAGAMASAVDWAQFARIARRHRVVPLAAQGIRGRAGVPPEIATPLAEAAAQEARQSLALAAETLRLQRLFDAAAIPFMVAKGTPLALLAYGDLGLKSSRDIDVLTSREKMLKAAELLRQAGYQSLVGEGGVLTEKGLEQALAFEKDVSFRNAAGHLVELHFTLARVPQLLPGLSAHIPAMEVPLGGGAIRTLDLDAGYVYLCLHGATHAWGRLKWLADLAGMVRSAGCSVETLHARAVAEGVPRLSFTALILMHELLGLDVPEHLLADGRSSLAVRVMVSNARKSLQEWDALDDWSERSMIRQRLNQLFYIRDAGYVRDMLHMMWTDDPDLRGWQPPRGLAFAYHMMRVPSWLWRLGRRAIRKKLAGGRK